MKTIRKSWGSAKNKFSVDESQKLPEEIFDKSDKYWASRFWFVLLDCVYYELLWFAKVEFGKIQKQITIKNKNQCQDENPVCGMAIV
eukprot:Pgem_evm1s14669